MKHLFFYLLICVLSSLVCARAALTSGQEEDVGSGGSLSPRSAALADLALNDAEREALQTFLGDSQVNEEAKRAIVRVIAHPHCPAERQALLRKLLDYKQALKAIEKIHESRIQKKAELDAYIEAAALSFAHLPPRKSSYETLRTELAISRGDPSDPLGPILNFKHANIAEGCNKLLESTSLEDQVKWAIAINASLANKGDGPLEALLRPEDPLWGERFRDEHYSATTAQQLRYSAITNAPVQPGEEIFESFGEKFSHAAYLNLRLFDPSYTTSMTPERLAEVWKGKAEDYKASSGDIHDADPPLVALQKAQFRLIARGYSFLCDQGHTVTPLARAGLWAALQLAEGGSYLLSKKYGEGLRKEVYADYGPLIALVEAHMATN